MRGGTRTRLFVLVITLTGYAAAAQGISGLHSFALSSGGNARLKIPVNENDVGGIHASLAEALEVRLKTQVTISASKPTTESLFGRFASLYASADSSDLFVGVCVGGWEADSATKASPRFAGLHRDTISAEYLTHFLQFIPTHNAVLFLIFPSRAGFPLDIVKTTGMSGGGGKYLVVVRTLERTTFANLVEEFLEALEEAKGGRQSDVSKDGFVSFSEWLHEVSTRCASHKIALMPYKFGDAEDYRIKQVNE